MTPDALRMREQGWHFEWQPSTLFIQASHPNGGKQSVLEIKDSRYLHFGPAIADALNGVECRKAMEEA